MVCGVSLFISVIGNGFLISPNAWLPIPGIYSLPLYEKVLSLAK